MRRRSKYGAKRTVVDGISFMSKLEAKRYSQLKLMEKGKVISDLKLQPRFPLVAGITYVADFSYIEAGAEVIEDVKGVETEVFRIKKKLFKHCYPHLNLRILKAKDL